MNLVISDFAALSGGSRWEKEEAGTEQESSNHGFIPCLGSFGGRKHIPGCS